MADINLTGDATPLIKALEAARNAFLKFDKTITQSVGNSGQAATSIARLETSLTNLARSEVTALNRTQKLAGSLELLAVEASKAAQTQKALQTSHLRGIAASARAEKTTKLVAQADLAATKAAGARAIANRLVTDELRFQQGFNTRAGTRRLASIRAEISALNALNAARNAAFAAGRTAREAPAGRGAGFGAPVQRQAAGLAAVRQQNAQLLKQETTLERIAREFRTLTGLSQNNLGVIRSQTAAYEGQVPILTRLAQLARQVVVGGGVGGGRGGGRGGGAPGTPGFNANLENGVNLFQRMGTAITDMGRLIGISLVIGTAFRLVQALEDAATAAIELENAIAEVRTIDTARVATDSWADSLNELANSFGIDVLDQAEAAYQALSNQVVTGATATEFLAAANRLAVTAVTDVSAATNLLTSALNAFNIDASRANEVSAIFFKTVELGRVRIDEMAESFGRIAVPANQIGVSLEELTAAIATTTINGIKFNEASTLVRNVILKLIRPTDALKKLFREVGVTSGEAAIQTFGLGGFLAILEEKTKGSTTELGELFGRIRAITGALVFSGEGLEVFNENLAKISSEQALKDFEANTLLVLGNVGKQLDIEKERFANFFRVEVGRELIEGILAVNDAVGGFTEVTRTISRIISATFIPAIVALATRMFILRAAVIQTAVATDVLTKSILFLRRATLVIVALAVAYEFLAESQERVVESGERLAKDLSKSIAAATQRQNKAVADAIAETGKLLEARGRLFSRPIATNVLAPLNKAFIDAEKGIKEFDKAFKLSTTKILSEANKLEADSQKAFDGFVEGSKAATKSVDDLFKAFEREVFELQLEDQDAATRINLITQRVEELNKARRAAVNTGNLEDFNKINTEIKELVIERGKLTDASQTGLDLEDRRALKLQRITELVEEEARLRTDIARTNEIQARAAEQIRVQQQLANEDLKSSFKLLTSTNFSDALAGGDETEIRRTLAEREAAAQRVVALQEELGVATRSNADIASNILKDRELAENRIAASRAASLVEERQANQAFLESRLNAFEAERQSRKESLDAELTQISSLRETIAEASAEPGLAARLLTGLGAAAGITFTPDATVLTAAFGEAGAAQAEALIPALDDLLRAQLLDPDTISDQTLKAIRADRETILEGLRELVGSRGSAEDISTVRQQQRDQFNAIQASQQQGGLSILGDATIQDLETSFARVDATFAIFESVLGNLSKSSGDLFKRQGDLRKSSEIILELNRKIQDAQNIDINSTNESAKSKDRLVVLEQQLENALKKDVEIRQRFTENFGDIGAATDLSVDDAFKAAQPTIIEVFKRAIAAAQPEAIANAVAGETAKQEITAQSIRAELEARGKAAADEARRQETIARLGPGAAERAALQAGTTGSARRRALAEARAQDREDKRIAASKATDERIAAQKRFAEEDRQARGEPGAAEAALAGLFPEQAKTAADARKELSEDFATQARTQADAQKALDDIRAREDARARGAAGIIPGALQEDPLTAAADAVTETVESNGLLATSLNSLSSRTDLLNETMTVLVNSILKEGESGFTSAQFSQGSINLTEGDPRLANQELGTTLEAFGKAGVELSRTFDKFEADELRRAEVTERFIQQTSLLNSAMDPVTSVLFPQFAQALRVLIPQLEPLIRSAAPGFTDGGPVPGSGNRDSIAAMLTPGEFVVRKRQAQKFMPQLLAMNSGRLRARGFADGGPVDVGGISFNVNESKSPQATARQVASEINRGIRQGTIKLRSNS